MKTTSKVSVLCLLFCLVAISSWAVNQGFMSNTAMSYFTKDDWTIFNQAQSKALNNTKDGVKVTWANPKSGANGYMIPSKTTRVNGMLCRDLSFFNIANQIQGEGSYRFCKSNGKWLIY